MKLQNNLPNLIIAGTVKGGTTSVFSYLSMHPDVCVSKIKETCFFLPLRYGKQRDNMNKYHSYFADCDLGKKVRVESTPGYLDGGRAVAANIKDEIKDVKIIFVLRNPVDRLKSFYRYQKAQLNLPKNMTFQAYLDACQQMSEEERKLQENDPFWGIDGGLYADYLADWYDAFGKENVRIAFFDDLVTSPREVMVELAKWLDIDPNEYETMSFEVENKTTLYWFAGLHRVAIAANRRMEPFLRKAPKFKRLVRKVYYSLNSEPEMEVISDEMLSQTTKFYTESNARLAKMLREKGYSSLPDWLL